jgi:hypothetical protein
MNQTTYSSPVAHTDGPMLLVTTAHPSIQTHLNESGTWMHQNLGRLVQPRHTSSIELTAAAGIPWAADNDCFQGLDEPAFVRMIDRIEGLPGCLFVSAPDVVGEAGQTLEHFQRWAPELERRRLPIALVAQDGLEYLRWAIEWDRISALFMGGTTEWKESEAARELADLARSKGKWVHWGRVNTKRRYDLAVHEHGDSFDGSKFARFRKTYLDGGLAWTVAA